MSEREAPKMMTPFKSAVWQSGILRLEYNSGIVDWHEVTVARAKDIVANVLDDFHKYAWEAASEAAAEAAAARYWEEGPASFQMMRYAEQQWEDERTGYWEMKDRERSMA